MQIKKSIEGIHAKEIMVRFPGRRARTFVSVSAEVIRAFGCSLMRGGVTRCVLRQASMTGGNVVDQPVGEIGERIGIVYHDGKAFSACGCRLPFELRRKVSAFARMIAGNGSSIGEARAADPK